MKISELGIKLIQHFERCRLTAYKDGEHYSIGWGHNSPDIEKGQKITRAKADELFLADLQWAEAAVQKAVKSPLLQHEYDALVSFVYNVGEPQFLTSTLLKRLNEGKKKAAGNQFIRWIYFESRMSHGLVKRRAVEGAIFKGQDFDNALKAGEEAYALHDKRLQDTNGR